MSALWGALDVAVLLLCGAATVTLIAPRQRRSLGEFVGLSIAMGCGLLAILLIWISMLGFKPSRANIALVCTCVAAGATLSGIYRGWPAVVMPAWRRPILSDLATAIPLLAIIAAVALVAMIALGYAFFEGDCLLIWGFKAKVLFYNPLEPKPPALTDAVMSFMHQDYPLLVPMLYAAAYAMAGQTNEYIGKLAVPLLYAAQALLAYSSARRWLGPMRAMCATALLVCMPFAIFLAGTGNPDPILMTFYLGSLVYLVRWIEQADRSDLLFSCLFCTFCAMTKQEGLPVALIELLAVLAWVIFRRNDVRHWQDFWLFAVILLLGAGIWWIWRMKLPHTVDNYDSRFHMSIILQNWRRIGHVIHVLGETMGSFPTWGGLWMLLPLAAAMGYGAFSRPQARVFWTLLLAHLILYVVTYVVSIWDVDRLLDVTRFRLLLHAAPAAMLLIALHWSHIGPATPRSQCEADGILETISPSARPDGH